jgi:hypothetical protein
MPLQLNSPLGSATGRHVRRAAPRNLFTECTETPVEVCGVVPEGCMTCVRHDINLGMRQSRAVLRDDLLTTASSAPCVINTGFTMVRRRSSLSTTRVALEPL